jgi:CHASE3 domain sensor protein
MDQSAQRYAGLPKAHGVSGTVHAFFLRRTILFGSALFILLVLMRLLYADFVNEKERQQWVTRSYQVLNATGALLSNLQDAETGQLGYLLTGEESYREPYQSALQEQAGSFC